MSAEIIYLKKEILEDNKSEIEQLEFMNTVLYALHTKTKIMDYKFTTYLIGMCIIDIEGMIEKIDTNKN